MDVETGVVERGLTDERLVEVMDANGESEIKGYAQDLRKGETKLLFAEQSVDPAKGLTPEEASSRLEKYGPNAIEEKSQSALKRFLGYFWGPLPWMVEAPAVMAAIIGDWVDFSIIVFMLLGFSPVLSVFYATLAAVAVSFFRRDTALMPPKLAKALAEGTTGILNVAPTCAAAGIIVGVVTLTGLAQRFADIIITYAAGSLLLTAVYTAAIVWVVGLAVPVDRKSVV